MTNEFIKSSRNDCIKQNGNRLNIDIYKVNVDENTDLAQQNGVQSIPTILVYKNGALAQTLVGLKSKEELTDIIRS